MDNDSSLRNIIAKSLGALWVLDGFLQFQPNMFGGNFISQVLAPNLIGQPPFLHAIVALGISLWSLNSVLANIAAALLQIAIGVLLLFPVTTKKFRIGLYISILWGIVVWFCGEGAGLLLTGTATFYTGAPGAVLFYIILALFLLLDKKGRAAWLPKIAGWTFVFGAALQAQSLFWAGNGITTSIMASTMEPFHTLNSFPLYVAHALSLTPVAGNVLLILMLLIIGLLLLFKPNRVAGTIALIFLLFVWWCGQDFGMLTSLFVATSTDPNTAPLLALFILPVFLAARSSPSHHKVSYNQGKLKI